MSDRIFKFKNGYTVAIRGDYMPVFLDVAMNAWTQEHPLPEMPKVPKKEVPAKGGTRLLDQPFDKQYLADLAEWKENASLWQSMFGREQALQRIRLAIVPDSIDLNVVAQMRAAYEAQGWISDPDDVKFYLNCVADPGYGVEGEKGFVLPEITLLIREIDKIQGPPGALVDHLLRTTFRNGNVEQQAEETRKHLGTSAESGSKPPSKTSRAVDADTGG